MRPFTCDGNLCNPPHLQNGEFSEDTEDSETLETVRHYIAGELLQTYFPKYGACHYSLLWYIRKLFVKFQVKM